MVTERCHCLVVISWARESMICMNEVRKNYGDYEWLTLVETKEDAFENLDALII